MDESEKGRVDLDLIFGARDLNRRLRRRADWYLKITVVHSHRGAEINTGPDVVIAALLVQSIQ